MSQDNHQSSIIIDSQMSFAEAIDGTKAPDHVIRELCLVDVLYYSFDGKLHQGQLVVHQSVRQEMEEIFALMRSERFPVARAIPIVRYGWSDNASMADNNTSAFNYRRVAGTRRLSRHATGHAVDINPIQNPVIYQERPDIAQRRRLSTRDSGNILRGQCRGPGLYRSRLVLGPPFQDHDGPPSFSKALILLKSVGPCMPGIET